MQNLFKDIKTGEDIPSPLNDETTLRVLPEMGGHGLYKILREAGASIEEAVIYVLSRQIGDDEAADSILEEYDLKS